MNQVSTGNSQPAFGFVKILGFLVVICITITTITHYLWPELTGVPSNPANVFNLVTGDITVAVLGIAAFMHGRRTMGTEKAAIFLVSAVLFSGIEETAWILSGRFGLVAPTYYFTSGRLWFFEIPVYTCIAWYLICYCGYSMVMVTRFPYEIARLAQNIAGGLLVTLPSAADFESKEVGKWVEKYTTTKTSVPAEDRCRMLRLIENINMGSAAVGYLTESMHGAGSPQAQRIIIGRLANLKEKQAIAKKLCGIEPSDSKD